jgi:hypothetical protein
VLPRRQTVWRVVRTGRVAVVLDSGSCVMLIVVIGRRQFLFNGHGIHGRTRKYFY